MWNCNWRLLRNGDAPLMNIYEDEWGKLWFLFKPRISFCFQVLLCFSWLGLFVPFSIYILNALCCLLIFYVWFWIYVFLMYFCCLLKILPINTFIVQQLWFTLSYTHIYISSSSSCKIKLKLKNYTQKYLIFKN